MAATRRWSSDGIFANALNPGAIATKLQKHAGGLRTPVKRRKTLQQGAAASVLLEHFRDSPNRENSLTFCFDAFSSREPVSTSLENALAASPLLEGIGGRYFEDCNEAATVSRRSPDFVGVARYALDIENAERLWDTSLGLIS